MPDTQSGILQVSALHLKLDPRLKKTGIIYMLQTVRPFFLSSFIILLSAACATSTQENNTFDGPLIWPQPPDQPRFAYETVLQSLADITKMSETDRMREKFSSEPGVSRQLVLDKPAAIVARNGRVYVADISTSTMLVFDVPRGRIFRFGLRVPGKLEKPSGLALDEQMNIYVADALLRKVLVYDSLGLFLRTVGESEDLERPTGVAVSRDGERIYVVDRSFNESGQHRVVVYDKEGKKLQVIGGRGSGDGQFNVPLQGAVAPDGTLYVLDSGNFRVQAFDRDGKFLHAFGAIGKELGNFSRPRGIAVDDEGNIYVTDARFNNFQIFNPNGELLMSVGQSSKVSNPGRYRLINGIAVDETGRVYVVDQGFKKIEVFRRLTDSEGKKMLQEVKK